MLKDTVGDKVTQVYIFSKRAMRQVKQYCSWGVQF